MTRRIVVVSTAVLALAFAAITLMVSQSLVVFGQTDVPGSAVKLKITSVSIGGDLKPVVSFTLTDERGNPLRLSDVDENSLRFTIARIETDASGLTQYLNYVVSTVKGAPFQLAGATVQPALATATQPGVDTGGVFSDLGSGKFTYTFATALPANFNGGLTHTVGGYVTRNARANVSNDLFDFVPNGGPITVTRQVVKTDSCNACHDDVQAHGGTRHLTGLCVLCHTPQNVDPETGNVVDFKVLIHKLHSGARLPSVEAGGHYRIIGFRQSVFDASDIVWPQDTRNCQTCHQGTNAANFKTAPSREACGSCHDNVDFATGKDHPGGIQTSNANCSACHAADGPEFGPSVSGAHTIPEKSTQLRGVSFEIVSVTNSKPGQNPTVTFNVKDKNGQTIKPSEMANIAFVLAGPTTDYATPPVTESASAATDAGGGNFAYTFKAKIPDNAAGTFAVGIQGYLNARLTKPSGQPVTNEGGSADVRDVGFNKVFYAAVTDAKPQPRKQVVDVKNCNQCHETLALHGGTRRNTEFCILCHNPTATDATKRTTAKGPPPPDSIVFSRLVHRIHTGEEQEDKPFIIFGGAPANPGPINLSEARFPTDRRNCTKCHVPGSNLLSFMRQGVQPTTVRQNDGTAKVTGAVQTVCNGCHDRGAAVAHADTMTASATREACVVCHNEDRDFAVSKLHPFRKTLTP